MRDVCFLLPAFLLKLAQGFMITFLMARHDGKQVMHAPAHIPLKKCASALWIDIEVLLVAFNATFVDASCLSQGNARGSRARCHRAGIAECRGVSPLLSDARVCRRRTTYVVAAPTRSFRYKMMWECRYGLTRDSCVHILPG